MSNIMRGRLNPNLVNDFEFTSVRAIDVLIDEMKTGSSVYDKTDDHKNAVMTLLLRVIVRDLSKFDIRAMTDESIDRLAFRIAIGFDAPRQIADPEIIAIEDAIKALRKKQAEI